MKKKKSLFDFINKVKTLNNIEKKKIKGGIITVDSNIL